MSLNIAEGQRVRVWSIYQDKGTYAVVKIGSSRKDKKSEEYVNSDWLAKFVGEAYAKLKELEIPEKGGVTIFLKGATATREKYKDKESGEMVYPKSAALTVFNFSETNDEDEEKPKSKKSSSGKKSSPPKFAEEDVPNGADAEEEDLPF